MYITQTAQTKTHQLRVLQISAITRARIEVSHAPYELSKVTKELKTTRFPETQLQTNFGMGS